MRRTVLTFTLLACAAILLVGASSAFAAPGATSVTIDVGPHAPTGSTDAHFEFHADEANVRYFICWLNGQELDDCGDGSISTRTFAWRGDWGITRQGDNSFVVQAFDLDGQLLGQDEWDWTIDTAAYPANPGIAFDYPPEDPAPETYADLGWHNLDPRAAGYSCELDGAPTSCGFVGSWFGPLVGAVRVTGLADGPHAFTVQALAGDSTPIDDPVTFRWSVDAATVSLTRPDDGTTVDRNVELDWTIHDPAPVMQVYVLVDGQYTAFLDPDQRSYRLDTSALADGPHSVKVRVSNETPPSQENSGNHYTFDSQEISLDVEHPPVSTAPPTITGPAGADPVDQAAYVGEPLTADPGGWDGNPTSFSYQWQQCMYNHAWCYPIDGATSQTYTPVETDAYWPGYLNVVVTATTAAGASASAESALTSSLMFLDFPWNQRLPSISGLPLVGETLSADRGDWYLPWSVTDFHYQWLRCQADGSNCNPIDLANDSTYTLTTDDLGSSLSVEVDATNPVGTESATASSPRIQGPLENTVLPTISGTPHADSLLSASPGSWDGFPSSFSYQWYRCAADGSSCSAIESATGSTYRQTEEDIDHTIGLGVVARNARGSSSAEVRSWGTQLVTWVAPGRAISRYPIVTGPLAVGETVGVDVNSSFTGPITGYTYKWWRCDRTPDEDHASGCVVIGGATDSTYTATRQDIGKYFLASVIAWNHSTPSFPASSPFSTFAFPPKVLLQIPRNLALPTISGTPRLGQTLSAAAGSWTGDPTSYHYQWYRCAAPGTDCQAVEGATAGDYAVTAADSGRYLHLTTAAWNEKGHSPEATSDELAVGDTTAPGATIDSAPSGTTTADAAAIRFSSDDATVSFECALDGAGWQQCTSPVSLSGLALGDHGFQIRATDAAGNVSETAAASWTIVAAPAPPEPAPDTTAPPAPTISAGPSGVVASSAATIGFSDSEAGVSFRCSTDGAPLSACASPATLGGLAVGRHEFAVLALDGAGNSSEAASAVWSVAPAGSKPDVVVAVHPTDETVAVGQQTGIEVQVGNLGTANAGDVVVTIDLGANARLLSAEAERASAGATLSAQQSPDCAVSGRRLSCHLGLLAPGQHYLIHVHLQATAPGQIVSKVTTSAEGSDTQPAAIAVSQKAIACTLSGSARNDVLRGTPGNDVICGFGGNDRIYGLGGDDVVFAGPGTDVVYGGRGNDILYGGSGADLFQGGAGNDLLSGGAAADTLRGGAGDDTLRGGFGADLMYGELGNDLLVGGTGHDVLYGGAGDDRFPSYGGIADEIAGGPGSDSAWVDRLDGLSSIEHVIRPRSANALGA